MTDTCKISNPRFGDDQGACTSTWTGGDASLEAAYFKIAAVQIDSRLNLTILLCKRCEEAMVCCKNCAIEIRVLKQRFNTTLTHRSGLLGWRFYSASRYEPKKCYCSQRIVLREGTLLSFPFFLVNIHCTIQKQLEQYVAGQSYQSFWSRRRCPEYMLHWRKLSNFKVIHDLFFWYEYHIVLCC